MSKIELPTITSGYNLSTINNNFQKIEDALNEEVLYRKGHLGEPNEMQTNLDMNGKQILNVVTGTSDGSLVTKGYVDQGLALKFDKSGGPLSGSIDMSSNEILNVSRLSAATLEIGGVQVIPTDLVIDPYNGTREALRRSYAEAGYNLVDGSFEAGGTLVNANDVLLHEAYGTAYNWDGVFPGGGKAVPPGSTPASTGGVVAGAWHPVGDITLREELAGLDGAALVGASSYAGIRSYTGSAHKIHCYGQSNVFDRAHGDFVLDQADVASVDNGGTILVDALGRRWKRQFSGAMKLHWFGAKGDRVADDTPSLIEAFRAVTALGRGCIEGEPGINTG